MSIGPLNLAWPLLLLLLPLPLIIKPKQPKDLSEQGIRVPYFNMLGTLSIKAPEAAKNKQKVRTYAFLLCWVALLIAAARPQWIGDPIALPQEGRDLMLAVDISPSMKETDMIIKGFQATRLDAVKSVVSNFITQRKGDRIGLILFGTQPYIQAPLTFDLNTVDSLLREATLGMAGQSTAIGDAIGLAVKRLRDKPEQSRVLILLTDGANTAGEVPPEKAAALAAQEKIKIYTVGIGAEEMIKQGFFSSRRVNPSADLDEKTLTQIAELTGGQYFRARSAPELDLIYESINQLEPIEQEGKTFRPVKELYHWPLIVSTILIGLLLMGRFHWRLNNSKNINSEAYQTNKEVQR